MEKGKKLGVVVLMSNKIDFKTKTIAFHPKATEYTMLGWFRMQNYFDQS